MIKLQWLGRVRYLDAWRWMKSRRDAVAAGHAPEVIWLLEHDPVITLGRRISEAQVDYSRAQQLGWPVYATERGGLATWHGPGQIVAYLILHIEQRGWKIREVVSAIEDGIKNWLFTIGILAERRSGFPGVWVGTQKIAAVGLNIHRGVSMHGFAVNLQPDLSAFSTITPCGIVDGSVTSVAQILQQNRELESAAYAVGHRVLQALLQLELSVKVDSDRSYR